MHAALNIHKKSQRIQSAPPPHVANSAKLFVRLRVVYFWQLKTTRMQGKVQSVIKQAFVSLVQVFGSSGSLYGWAALTA